MIASITAYFAQLEYQTLIPQFGFGGVLVWVIVTWLKKIETSLESLNHSMRTLSKSVLLDLAERAQPGSFVREEAKRMIAKENARAGD